MHPPGCQEERMGRISVLRLPEGPALHSPACTRFKQCFGRSRRAPWMQMHPKQRPIASCQSPDGINVVARRREPRNASSSPACADAPPAPRGGTRLRCNRGCMQGLEGSSWNPTCTRAPASPQVPKGHAEEPGNSPGLLWEGKELTLP